MWLRIIFWNLLTIIGLCCLLSHLPPISYTNHEMSSEGPSFSDFSDFYADFLNENASVWFHVTVTDSDCVGFLVLLDQSLIGPSVSSRMIENRRRLFEEAQLNTKSRIILVDHEKVLDY